MLSVRKAALRKNSSILKKIIVVISLFLMAIAIIVSVAGVIHMCNIVESMRKVKAVVESLSEQDSYAIKFRGVEICVKATEHGNKVYSVRNDDNAAGYVVIKENKCYINVMGMKNEWIMVPAEDVYADVADTKLDVTSLFIRSALNNIGISFDEFNEAVRNIAGIDKYRIKVTNKGAEFNNGSSLLNDNVSFGRIYGIRITSDGIFCNSELNSIKVDNSGNIAVETDKGELEYSMENTGNTFQYIEKNVDNISYDLKQDNERYEKFINAYEKGSTIFDSLKEAFKK